jgi:hypothetical protein
MDLRLRQVAETAYPEITPKMEFCPDWRPPDRNSQIRAVPNAQSARLASVEQANSWSTIPLAALNLEPKSERYRTIIVHKKEALRYQKSLEIIQ